MLRKHAYWHVIVPILMLSLTGCAEFDLRKGPSPVLDGAAVYNAAGNKAILMRALAIDAGFDPDGPVDYYKVAEAGFNYVDDQCRSYFDTLFFLNKGREQLKSGLAASGQTTAAILGITGAAAPTIAIVAQAFGLASAATDIVTGTYLYALPPATTQAFVERLQLAYREAAANNSAHIQSPASAYFHIQRYLNLCLPPAIEAEITKQISSAGAISIPSASGAFFDVQSVGAPVSTLPKVVVAPAPRAGPVSAPRGRFIGPSPVPREDVRRTRIEHVTEPVQRPTPLKREDVTSTFVRQIQAALCVEPINGVLGDSTRHAIQDYLRGRNKHVPDQIDPLDPVLHTLLADAVDDVGDCRAGGFKNAYEVGGYGVPSDRTASKIKTLQKNMAEELKARGSALTIEQTGKFDSQTRKAISELRPALVPGTAGDYLDGSLDAQLH